MQSEEEEGNKEEEEPIALKIGDCTFQADVIH